MNLAGFYAIFDRYLLVLIRVTAFLGATPFFGTRNIPTQLKVGFALLVAYFLLPAAHVADPGMVWGNIGAYSAAVGRELLVGLVLGFAVSLTFSALQVAGQLVDVPIGFSMVNVLDPQMAQQVPIMGQFQYILVVLLFLAMDGHHFLLQALAKTFTLVPLGGYSYFKSMSAIITKGFSNAFLLGFQISLPVVAALFLTDLALGVVARAVPQMNVFIVGFPLKIFVGLIFVMLVLPIYVNFVELAFGPNSDLYGMIGALLKGGASGGR